MILLVDSGNSSTRFVFADATTGSVLARHDTRSASLGSTGAVEQAVETARAALGRAMRTTECEGAIYATVVPAREDALRNGIVRALGPGTPGPLAVGPSLAFGIEIAVDSPEEIGPDRIANAEGAFHLYGGPVIAIDAGTALTMEVVDAGGRFLGGVITLGPGSVRDLIGDRGARLHAPELAWPSRAIGTNTEDALRAGIVRGAVAAVDGLVRDIRDELGAEARAIATGGLGRLIAARSRTVSECNEGLTLTGLKTIYDRNRPIRPGGPSKS